MNYCMKRINMLRMKNVKVLVVFDGSHLPTKANVEAERRKLVLSTRLMLGLSVNHMQTVCSSEPVGGDWNTSREERSY